MIIKKVLLILFSLLLLGLILITVGCFDETDKANELVDKANKYIAKSNKLEKESQKTFDKIKSLPGSGEEFKTSLKLSREAKEKINNQEKEIKSSIYVFKKAKRLNVSEEYKKYLDMEIKATEIKLNSTRDMAELADLFIFLFKKGVRGIIIDKDIENFGKKAQRLINKSESLDNAEEKLLKKAEKYFVKQDLG